ncbi:hypothetical protein ASPZODRAFT_564907 [Penicilliopsis zonata CBS 506.65]|uniref:Uncharacterized protein n=1 Tax=Penicilliopsis zonata CBS 506.65 TaxID=1073090 RepID=A0A1L9SDM6_9EURO|nr:hypothetical protein ASPZODRAFT_564907 [Penicilliopsis zonata CBS 506.65]OJJ45279.1 hypothetical protein ASPZODRAFT_564907 [Penicilliopsis zonata CBS 506.65]
MRCPLAGWSRLIHRVSVPNHSSPSGCQTLHEVKPITQLPNRRIRMCFAVARLQDSILASKKVVSGQGWPSCATCNDSDTIRSTEVSKRVLLLKPGGERVFVLLKRKEQSLRRSIRDASLKEKAGRNVIALVLDREGV